MTDILIDTCPKCGTEFGEPTKVHFCPVCNENIMDARLRVRYAREDWGQVLLAAGFDPVNTESAAREVARHCARVLDMVNKTLYATGAPLGSDRYFVIRQLCTVKNKVGFDEAVAEFERLQGEG